MAKGLNRVMLIGNLGQDPDVRYSANGNAIANVSIATAEGKKDQNGDWQDHTEWHKLIFFGKTAEVAKDYLRKGSKIYIEGRLQTRSWEKDGIKRYTTEIVVSQLLMLDGRNDSQGGQPQNTGSRAPSTPPPSNTSDDRYNNKMGDDDLPF